MTSWLPPAASTHAAGIDRVTLLVHGLMVVLFIGWLAYFTWALIRFRRKRQPTARAASATGRWLFFVEAGVVVAEVAILVVFALPVWFERTSARPAGADALSVRVVAEQFAWNIHYPGPDGRFGTTAIGLVTGTNPLGLDRTSSGAQDDVVVVNELHVPVNRPVIIQLTSKDVIHSFGVPAMRVKQDAIPGMTTPVWFTPTREGEFDVACSQLCGLAHYRMRAIVTVESDAAFAEFLRREAALR